MDRWTYEVNLNSDIWNGEIFDTKEEAIAEGRKEAIEYKKDSFKYDEVGEVAEDYLDDVSKKDALELEEKLNEVFYKWQEEHNYKPSFYKVISEEIIKVE